MTDRELVYAIAKLFDESDPETDAQVNALLLEAGYDPERVAKRMEDAAKKALEKSRKLLGRN